MIATGLGFAAFDDVLAAGSRRADRHAQPERRRRQRLPADRAGAAAGHRPGRAAHRAVRPLQPHRNAGRRRRRALRRRAGVDRRPPRRSRDDVAALGVRRSTPRSASSCSLATGCCRPPSSESARRRRRALGESRARRLPAGRTVQPRRVRRRLRDHRPAGAVAATALRHVDRRGRGGVLLGRCAVGVLGARRRPHRPAHRAGADDGVHPPARQRPARSSPRSCRPPGPRSPACWHARRCRRWTSRPAPPT